VRRLLVIVALTSAAAARADEEEAPPHFARSRSVRMLLGGGTVPAVASGFLTVEAEWLLRPFNGALSVGTAASGSGDVHGLWSDVTLGLSFALDLTYLFLSGFWWVEPSPTFPVRLSVGARLGLTFSRSWLPRPELSSSPEYQLLRPELHPFLDVEVPLPCTPHLSALARVAIDTNANPTTLFRWAAYAGMSWGYER